jgi:hypothetical protein
MEAANKQIRPQAPSTAHLIIMLDTAHILPTSQETFNCSSVSPSVIEARRVSMCWESGLWRIDAAIVPFLGTRSYDV